MAQAQVAEGRLDRYLTLDDLTLLAAAQLDPQGFLSGLQGRVVLDEVQRAPGLFLPLKALVDRERRPGRFLLTGSANVLALPRAAEHLVGRMALSPSGPSPRGSWRAGRRGSCPPSSPRRCRPCRGRGGCPWSGSSGAATPRRCSFPPKGAGLGSATTWPRSWPARCGS
nr:AAA family ATPase [Thermus arciformis]